MVDTLLYKKKCLFVFYKKNLVENTEFIKGGIKLLNIFFNHSTTFDVYKAYLILSENVHITLLPKPFSQNFWKCKLVCY